MKLFWFVFLIANSIFAQDFSKAELDKMEDEVLLSLFKKVEHDSIKAEKVARTYLDRARKEKDTIKMARGYDRLARIFHPQKNLQFADSIIYLTNNLNNITFPAQAYILKGYEYEVLGYLRLSTKNYINAFEIALKNRNVQQQLFASNRLIFLKTIWGNKREALELQRKRHKILKNKSYLKEINKSTREGFKNKISDIQIADELSSFENFVFCFINLKELDSAYNYVDKALALNNKYLDGLRKENSRLFFNEASIEIDYYAGNYQNAIIVSNELLSIFKSSNDINSIQNIYLFKGLSLIELNDEERGIIFLKKTDSMFDKYAYIIKHPYQRVLYEKLLAYYRNQGNTNKRLEYLKKLIETDSIIKKNYQYFEPTLIKEFENPELFKEKEQLIEELKNENLKSKSIIWIALGVLSTSLFIIFIYWRKQLKYRYRFKELMSQKNADINNGVSKLSTGIYDDLVNRLNVFEGNRGYLKKELTINNLAKEFGTNHKYLSKVINIEKENNFSQYINNLRVSFAFEELQTNEKLRSFTIIAIAKESGFKNAESFSKAFYKKYKIKPSFYLKQIEKKSKFI